jgi:prepilin-type N-terminal cleavage/methylation domain-containing protein
MQLSARQGSVGFSLVEVVLTMAVLAVALALAGRLILESQLGLVRAQAELLNPLPRYALARLRADLETASDVAAILPGWRSSPLLLSLAGGERVAWQQSGAALERLVVDGAGAVLVRHVALRDVAGWRWREVSPGLIDVEVTTLARDTAAVPLVGVARTWSPPRVERSDWERVALRAEVLPP